MKNLKIIAKGFSEMNRLEKRLFPCVAIYAVTTGLSPFINIYFTAKIIDLLEQSAKFEQLIGCISLAVILNLIFKFTSDSLMQVIQSYRSNMYTKELASVANKLFKTQFVKKESSDFKELVHKHSEAQDRVYSSFVQLTWMMRDFLCGLITLCVSVVIIFPLLKLGFQTTGSSFFERPIFLLSIIGAIAVMAVIILVVALKMNKAWFAASDEYSRLDRLFYYFINMFSDYKTGKEIRLYKQQDLIGETATKKLLTDGEKILKKASMNTAKSSSFVAVLGALVGFGIYLFIGVKGLYGLYGTGSLVLYCGSFMQIINGIMKMAATFGKTEEMAPMVKYYFDIINSKDEMSYGTKELKTDKFEIEFKNVSFKYPGSDSYSLRNINLKISNGEHLAVVGRNGSGKTTFIKLLCRLYDVTEGAILINGENIKSYSKQSLNKLYSVVFQDFKMFSLPLFQNISASDSCENQRLLNCLEEADILKRVETMPKKENTVLYKSTDKNGVEISGGEAQKLALARALYKNSPIVILDEPTAALDPLAENEIYSKFNGFVENKTAIYISHRLSSCVFCSRIAVFDSSRLVQTGTHRQLLSESGKYSELWNAQAKYYLN